MGGTLSKILEQGVSPTKATNPVDLACEKLWVKISCILLGSEFDCR